MNDISKILINVKNTNKQKDKMKKKKPKRNENKIEYILKRQNKQTI